MHATQARWTASRAATFSFTAPTVQWERLLMCCRRIRTIKLCAAREDWLWKTTEHCLGRVTTMALMGWMRLPRLSLIRCLRVSVWTKDTVISRCVSWQCFLTSSAELDTTTHKCCILCRSNVKKMKSKYSILWHFNWIRIYWDILLLALIF